MRISDWSSDVCSSDLTSSFWVICRAYRYLSWISMQLSSKERGAHDQDSFPQHCHCSVCRCHWHGSGALSKIQGDRGVPPISSESDFAVPGVKVDVSGDSGAQRSEKRRVGKECVS